MIRPRLGEEVNLRTKLRIEEHRKPRLKQRAVLRAEHAGGRQLHPVAFQIEGSAEPAPPLGIASAERKKILDLIKEIFRRGGRKRYRRKAEEPT